MKTTLDLPEDLFRRVKAKAALDGETITKLVVRALEREVPPAAPRMRIQVPLIRAAHPIPSLTNAEIDALLDREDYPELLAGRESVDRDRR